MTLNELQKKTLFAQSYIDDLIRLSLLTDVIVVKRVLNAF